MNAADIRAYARRDWARVEDEKARFWSEWKRTRSPAQALEVGESLRRHARTLKPDWPSEAERAEDLAVHRRVAEALRACTRYRAG